MCQPGRQTASSAVVIHTARSLAAALWLVIVSWHWTRGRNASLFMTPAPLVKALNSGFVWATQPGMGAIATSRSARPLLVVAHTRACPVYRGSALTALAPAATASTWDTASSLMLREKAAS